MDVQNSQDLTNHVKFSSLKRFTGLLEESDRKYKRTIQRFDSRMFDFEQFSFITDIGSTTCGVLALKMAKYLADNGPSINFDVFLDIAKLWIQLPNKHLTVKKSRMASFYAIWKCLRKKILKMINNLKMISLCCLTLCIPRYRELIKM